MTLHPRDLQHLTRETYAAHCVLMGLGFAAGDLYVATPFILNANPPGVFAAVLLRPNGTTEANQFVLWLGNPPLIGSDTDCFLRAWQAFARAQPSMPRSDLDQIVTRSQMYAHKADIVRALVLRGIPLPGVLN